MCNFCSTFAVAFDEKYILSCTGGPIAQLVSST